MKHSNLTAAALGGLLLLPVLGVADIDDEHHNIDEIIVSALPLGRSVEALSQSTAVVVGDALARSQDISIGETLDGQLGVSATYFGPVASRPVIRGQYGERVLMLSNGLDSLDASALSEDHATSVDSLLAERVEIIRGPATLIYGSSAAGGIVNVVDSRIHETPLDSELSGAASLGSDSATGMSAAAFKLDFGSPRFVGHFDFMRRDTDNVEIPGFAESFVLREAEGELDGEPEGYLENSDSDSQSSALAFTVFGSDDDFLGFSVSAYESMYGIPGGHAHGEEHEGDEPHEDEEESVRIDLEQRRYEVRGQLGLGGFFEALTLKAARNDYEHTELEGGAVGTIFENDGTDVRVELLHRANDRLAGTLGLQYKSIDLVTIGDEAFVPPSETEQLGLYAFQEWSINEDWVIQGSGRIEQQRIATADFPEYDNSSLGASLGSIWTLNDAMTLSANLALTERQPNATELYAFGPHLAADRFERGSVTLGNGELTNEVSTNIDVTLRGELDRFSWAVTAFNNDVRDYILLSPTGEIEDGLQVYDFRQSDATLYGLEGEVLVDLLRGGERHVHARFFADFVHAEEGNGAYLPRITPARFGSSLHISQGKLDASLGATYHDRQTRLAVNELPTDSYTMIDAELSYRFDDPGLMLFLRGSNLGDEDARRHTSPLKDIAPLPGRSLRLGLRLDF